MSTMRIILRRAVAGSALVAAAALPLQSGVAHAATPDEEFSSCITTVDTASQAALIAGAEYDISAAVDACVRTFLTELGTDQSAVDTGTVDPASADTGGVNSFVIVDTGGVNSFVIVDTGVS